MTLDEFDEQPGAHGTMDGTIWCFLTGNRFRVELYDGLLVDAVVPDHLIEQIRPYYVGPPALERIAVVVEFRERPAMHRITEIKGFDGWFSGEPRACRR